MATYPYRTVIVTPATSTALVDAATVFAELGVTAPTVAETTQMETVIGQISALIDRFLDRSLAEATVTDYFREAYGDTLRLSRWPVTEILDVDESGTALAEEAWELNDTTGELYRISSADRYDWAASGTTTVSYTGGYALPDDLPADIQRAAIDQIKAQYMGGARDPALRSVNVPDVVAVSYSVAGGDSYGKGLLSQVEAALMPYRRIVV